MSGWEAHLVLEGAHPLVAGVVEIVPVDGGQAWEEGGAQAAEL